MNDSIIRIDLSGVNCYLVKGENGFILFDTGGHLVMDQQFTNRRDHLVKELEAAGCTEHNLNLIVLTHGDNDHACNAAYLRERFHAKIAMHDDDRELVESPSLQKWMESFHYSSLAYNLVLRLMKKTITKATQKALDDFQSFSPDVLLEDGFSMSPYGLEAFVIHVPGHTNGSIAILTQNGDLIAGDTFTNVKNPDYAKGANDFKQLSESVNKLRGFAIGTVYPGHGEPFEFRKLNG